MSHKSEPFDSTANCFLSHRRFYCPEHGQKFMYQCLFQQCPSQLVCSHHSCLDSHFHQENQNRLILQKFNCQAYKQKFEQLDRMLNKQQYSQQAKKLKSMIDQLKVNMVDIYKNYRELHSRKEMFLAEAKKPFTLGSMDIVVETIEIGNQLSKSIQILKGKLKFNDNVESLPQKDGNSQKDIRLIESPTALSSKEKDDNTRSNPTPSIFSESRKKNEQKSNEEGQIVVNQSDPSFVPIQLQQSKNPPKDFTETISPEKLANFRSFLQSINTTGNKSPSNQLPSTVDTSQVKKYLKSQNGIMQTLKVYESDFLLKKEFTIFLEQRIKGFTWGSCVEVYSSSQPLKTIEKFHEMLEDKRNLLFIFISENCIVGSFYPSRYPKMATKLRNDPNSFIFVSNEEKTSIVEYKPIQTEFHLSVCNKLYICQGNTPSYFDGIRTNARNLNEISYHLPSKTYRYVDASGKINEDEAKVLSGTVKVKDFYILQVPSDMN